MAIILFLISNLLKNSFIVQYVNVRTKDNCNKGFIFMLPIRPEDVLVKKTQIIEDFIRIFNQLITSNYTEKDNSSSFSLKEIINSINSDTEMYLPEDYEITICTSLYPKIKKIYESYGWNVELRMVEGPAYFKFTKK